MYSRRCWLAGSFVLLICSLVPAAGFAQAPSGPAAQTAQAPAKAPTPAVTDGALALSLDDAQGSLAAELGMAVLGDLVGMALTGAAMVANSCFACEYEEDRSGTTETEAAAWSMIARPLLIGGLASAGGRLSGGQGRSGFAILGAVPGSVMLAVGWARTDTAQDGLSVALVAGGHFAAIGGSVAAYRYSARLRFSQRTERALRYTPTPFVDGQRRTAGLSLSGKF
jgi:hypothetical protein